MNFRPQDILLHRPLVAEPGPGGTRRPATRSKTPMRDIRPFAVFIRANPFAFTSASHPQGKSRTQAAVRWRVPLRSNICAGNVSARGTLLLSIKKHRVCDQTDAENDARDPGHVDEADNNSFVECHALPVEPGSLWTARYATCAAAKLTREDRDRS